MLFSINCCLPRTSETSGPRDFAKPQGAPRGLLLHYILYKISLKPAHGYEILQDIEEKTEGAWRPGAGSIYPMLKKLVQQGYIKAESKSVETSLRVYRITPKGRRNVQEAKEMFANAGQRWSAIRRIFIEMLATKDISKFLVDGARVQFDVAREALESKIHEIPQSEVEFILKEYDLNLQRQLDWSRDMMNKLKRTGSVAVPSIRTPERKSK